MTWIYPSSPLIRHKPRDGSSAFLRRCRTVGRGTAPGRGNRCHPGQRRPSSLPAPLPPALHSASSRNRLGLPPPAFPGPSQRADPFHLLADCGQGPQRQSVWSDHRPAVRACSPQPRRLADCPSSPHGWSSGGRLPTPSRRSHPAGAVGPAAAGTVCPTPQHRPGPPPVTVLDPQPGTSAISQAPQPVKPAPDHPWRKGWPSDKSKNKSAFSASQRLPEGHGDTFPFPLRVSLSLNTNMD